MIVFLIDPRDHVSYGGDLGPAAPGHEVAHPSHFLSVGCLHAVPKLAVL